MKPSLPQHLGAETEIARHAHVQGYATLVLDGSYEEAGDSGRFRVRPGDVLLHAPFSAHRDRILSADARVLDLALPFDGREWMALGRLRDPDTVLRTARRDECEAAALLVEAFEPIERAEQDLADLLAQDLSDDPGLSVADWAEAYSVSRETAWRHFRKTYGVDPSTYRWEARGRHAWRQVMQTPAALADIAAATGFSDQAHMTRTLKALTGRSPGSWRATSVQDGGARRL